MNNIPLKKLEKWFKKHPIEENLKWADMDKKQIKWFDETVKKIYLARQGRTIPEKYIKNKESISSFYITPDDFVNLVEGQERYN